MHKTLFVILNIIAQIIALVLILKFEMFELSYPGSDSGPGSSLSSILFSIFSPFLILIISGIIWKLLKFKQVFKISLITFLISLVFWSSLISCRLIYMNYTENQKAHERMQRRAIKHKKNLDILIQSQDAYTIVTEHMEDRIFDGYLIQNQEKVQYLMRMTQRNNLRLYPSNIPSLIKTDSMAIHYFTLESIHPFIQDSIYYKIKSVIDSGFVATYNPAEYRNYSSYKESKTEWTMASYSLDLYQHDTIFELFIHYSTLNRNTELEDLFFDH